ncbi:MAG: hypothetical protein M2R45_02789 [Verrucomicrobia subdivision 3 bacterium]|nr:hypothetical protein [Limisphaerales bacterium]MCS1414339.1 hypothetical protein [Limisphaerales bacterium]
MNLSLISHPDDNANDLILCILPDITHQRLNNAELNKVQKLEQGEDIGRWDYTRF